MPLRRTVTFEIIGIAQPKGSTRAFMPKGGRFPIVTSDNPHAKSWQQLVSAQAQAAAAGGLFAGPVVLDVRFYLPRPSSLPRRVVYHMKKPDLDKLIRSVSDALTGILYADDKHVIEIRAAKSYATGITAPRAIVTVSDVDPESFETSTAPLFSAQEITT